MTTNKQLPPEESTDNKQDSEYASQRIPYPKSVFFIVANEFCERFSFYGLKTILVIYLNYVLLFSTDNATVIYHVFNMLAYFFPVLGAIIADSWLGKFKTILYLSIVYAVGNIVISVTAITSLQIPQSELTMLGLVLVAIGTGGIKPCVSAFGGDQFILPQQEIQLQRFFSVFYFSINAGSLISTFLTPVLREDVHCFGEESCFSLAFGVPAILMVVSIAAFVTGSKWYRMEEPKGNVVVQVSKCVWYAWTKKSTGEAKREHWLDKADDRFEKKFIEDCKGAFKVLVLYIPVPIFWALFDQQGSRWTFQAARMSGDLGGAYIKPDQMQIFNPVLILVFIPLFESVVYPLFAKCNLIKRPLQKMVVGGLLAALAFVISAIVELELHETYPVLPVAGEGQLRLYNALGCETSVNLQNVGDFQLKSLDKWENISIPVADSIEMNLSWTDCTGRSKSSPINIFEERATSYTLRSNGDPFRSENEDLDKSDNGDPMVMFVYGTAEGKTNTNLTVNIIDADGNKRYTAQFNETYVVEAFKKIPRGSGYTIQVGRTLAKGTFEFEQGGSYAIVAVSSDNDISVKNNQVTSPNSLNMMWLVPQYVVITAAEVMYSIPGLEFSFTQAPVSMKSLMTSAWLLTVAFGNLVVIIVAEAKIFDNQAYEFLLFAGLMFLDVLIFMYLATQYKYVDPKRVEEISMTTAGSGVQDEKPHENGVSERPTNTHQD